MSKKSRTIKPITGVVLETPYLEKGAYDLVLEHYLKDNSISIQVVSQADEDGYVEPMCRATVCMPEYTGLINIENQVFIKDWAENEGIAEALVKAGVLSITDIAVYCGSETAWAYNLNMGMIKYADEDDIVEVNDRELDNSLSTHYNLVQVVAFLDDSFNPDDPDQVMALNQSKVVLPSGRVCDLVFMGQRIAVLFEGVELGEFRYCPLDGTQDEYWAFGVVS